MIKITPRFFVLPLIALTVIASLPRPAAESCVVAPSRDAMIRADSASAPTCAPAHERVAMAPASVLIR